MERKRTAVVLSAKAADQGQGRVGLPRGRGAVGFLPQDLGGFAEGHCGEANLPLLTLSEFSADLGSILQQSVL